MWTFFLVIVLVLAVVLGINAVVPNPVEEGREYSLRTNADISKAEAVISLNKAVQLNILEVKVAEEAKNEQIGAQKVSIWASAYAKAASKVVGVFALSGLALGLFIAAVGFSSAFARKAHFVADLVYPNKQMQLPVQKMHLISTDGYKRVFAFDYGSKEVIMLNAENEADAQTITAIASSRTTALLATAAVLASKNGVKQDFSTIDPEHIVKQLVENTRN